MTGMNNCFGFVITMTWSQNSLSAMQARDMVSSTILRLADLFDSITIRVILLSAHFYFDSQEPLFAEDD